MTSPAEKARATNARRMLKEAAYKDRPTKHFYFFKPNIHFGARPPSLNKKSRRKVTLPKVELPE